MIGTEKDMKDNILKVAEKAGSLGDSVTVSSDKSKITLTYDANSSKSFLRNLYNVVYFGGKDEVEGFWDQLYNVAMDSIAKDEVDDKPRAGGCIGMECVKLITNLQMTVHLEFQNMLENVVDCKIPLLGILANMENDILSLEDAVDQILPLLR